MRVSESEAAGPAADDAEVEILSGRVADLSNPSVRTVLAADWGDRDVVAQAAEMWLEAFDSPHTAAAYRRDLTLWLEWCDQNAVPVHDARRNDVDRWRGSMAANSRATVARRLSAISSFYAYWHHEGAVARNPARESRRPKMANTPKSIRLTGKDAGALLRYVDSLKDKRPAVIVRLLAETGMRVGELCGARIEQLGLSGGHHILEVQRKGDKPQQLPIAAGTRALVDEYIGDRESGWILYVEPSARRRGDGQMDRAYVRQLLRRVSEEAGLPKDIHQHMHPHVLRHSAATLLAEDNVPVHEIQALLGHADLRTTQRYIHHAGELDASPVYRLAALLAKGKASE